MKFFAPAVEQIINSITDYGIMAGTSAVDNYQRVWSRDQAMAGITGILINDKQILEGLKSGIRSLSLCQSKTGHIPSNISINSDGSYKLSYGTLSGKVDATTWWIVSAALLLLNHKDESLKTELLPSVEKAVFMLETIEYNQKHLIYTPLAGNWADEYFLQGHTLYDNCLYYWAVKLIAELYDNEQWVTKSKQIKQAIIDHFSEPSDSHTMNVMALRAMQELDYFPPCFQANKYFSFWDMSGNALALLLGIDDKKNNRLIAYLESMALEYNTYLLPVFYPVIVPTSAAWQELQHLQLYRFKNEPNSFQNGGSWPIFLAWLSLGLSKLGNTNLFNKIFEEYSRFLEKTETQGLFYEYINPITQQNGGVDRLNFSASAYLMMQTCKLSSPQNIQAILRL